MSVLDLNGVADPAERKRLQLQVDRLVGPRALWKLIPIASLGFALIMAMIELRWIPTSPTHWWSRYVVLFILFLPLVIIGQRWVRRDHRRAMIELLKCELRCTSCGYALKGSSGKTCPECGALRPFPMTGCEPAGDEIDHGLNSH
jgi:hypothetical protein